MGKTEMNCQKPHMQMKNHQKINKSTYSNLFLNVIYSVVLLTIMESEATGSGHRSVRQRPVLRFKKTQWSVASAHIHLLHIPADTDHELFTGLMLC